MTGYELCIVILLLGGLGPVVLMGARGQATGRLVALEMGSTIVTVLFLLFAQVSGQSYELILPLVLVLLSFAGSLVFTRLLSQQDRN
ncbi:MAG TPA: monovalent cation/H+ antiporter complex subunit F [Acidimicrobiales bacterium]|jgi:multisubunit Na+/H+ antiporter MnhF subunit|nr:monovalent cation/H+ antiporter complex subunit F [Acidimicrobiales bacterium]